MPGRSLCFFFFFFFLPFDDPSLTFVDSARARSFHDNNISFCLCEFSLARFSDCATVIFRPRSLQNFCAAPVGRRESYRSLSRYSDPGRDVTTVINPFVARLVAFNYRSRNATEKCLTGG